MSFSYKPLWKLLIDREINKNELRRALNLSTSTVAKMSKGENVSLEIIGKICGYLSCQPGDILEFIPEEKETP